MTPEERKEIIINYVAANTEPDPDMLPTPVVEIKGNAEKYGGGYYRYYMPLDGMQYINTLPNDYSGTDKCIFITPGHKYKENLLCSYQKYDKSNKMLEIAMAVIPIRRPDKKNIDIRKWQFYDKEHCNLYGYSQLIQRFFLFADDPNPYGVNGERIWTDKDGRYYNKNVLLSLREIDRFKDDRYYRKNWPCFRPNNPMYQWIKDCSSSTNPEAEIRIDPKKTYATLWDFFDFYKRSLVIRKKSNGGFNKESDFILYKVKYESLLKTQEQWQNELDSKSYKVNYKKVTNTSVYGSYDCSQYTSYIYLLEDMKDETIIVRKFELDTSYKPNGSAMKNGEVSKFRACLKREVNRIYFVKNKTYYSYLQKWNGNNWAEQKRNDISRDIFYGNKNYYDRSVVYNMECIKGNSNFSAIYDNIIKDEDCATNPSNIGIFINALTPIGKELTNNKLFNLLKGLSNNETSLETTIKNELFFNSSSKFIDKRTGMSLALLKTIDSIYNIPDITKLHTMDYIDYIQNRSKTENEEYLRLLNYVAVIKIIFKSLGTIRSTSKDGKLEFFDYDNKKSIAIINRLLSLITKANDCSILYEELTDSKRYEALDFSSFGKLYIPYYNTRGYIYYYKYDRDSLSEETRSLFRKIIEDTTITDRKINLITDITCIYEMSAYCGWTSDATLNKIRDDIKQKMRNVLKTVNLIDSDESYLIAIRDDFVRMINDKSAKMFMHSVIIKDDRVAIA